MGILTPPDAPQVQVRYAARNSETHCHIIGERLFCCGLEIITDAFGGWTFEPGPLPMCPNCEFVTSSINRGVQVGYR